MRARFTPPRTNEAAILQGLDALKEGREYPVLEVFAPYGKSALFRLEFIEGEDPALFDSRAFIVTSSVMPPSWRYFQFDSGSFALRPKSWSRTGFWEAYYEHEPEALAIYEVEKQKILSSS
ncbi:hypothetical protein [Streptomyces bluensis]|uniref:Uncharacterized protein n=1 Tax=Streptomyces bluensis TaxID=33897 RepID=A0ABW6UNK8_9ACTN